MKGFLMKSLGNFPKEFLEEFLKRNLKEFLKQSMQFFLKHCIENFRVISKGILGQFGIQKSFLKNEGSYSSCVRSVLCEYIRGSIGLKNMKIWDHFQLSCPKCKQTIIYSPSLFKFYVIPLAISCNFPVNSVEITSEFFLGIYLKTFFRIDSAITLKFFFDTFGIH